MRDSKIPIIASGDAVFNLHNVPKRLFLAYVLGYPSSMREVLILDGFNFLPRDFLPSCGANNRPLIGINGLTLYCPRLAMQSRRVINVPTEISTPQVLSILCGRKKKLSNQYTNGGNSQWDAVGRKRFCRLLGK